MKRVSLLFISIVLSVVNSDAQSPLLKITDQYYRSKPFKTEFSSFLSHLLNDPTLSDKVIRKRTDTSLFYFQGTYSAHKPFFFKPATTKVILMEMAVQTDSLSADTIYNYQLLAFAEATEEGKKNIRKEFERIYRKYRSSFSSSSMTENPDKTKMPSTTYNFFDNNYIVAPFALTLAGPGPNNEMCLILTVRMSISNNEAQLPVSLYGF